MALAQLDSQRRSTSTPVLQLPFARLVLAGLVWALAPGTVVSAQTVVLSSAGQFSGGETVLDFEGIASGTQISNQFASQGATFALDDGGLPWVEIEPAATPRGVLQNFAPGSVGPGGPPLPNVVVSFSSLQNRVGFRIKNNLNDDLILSLHCCRNGSIIGSHFFVTSFSFQFVGLESIDPFDQIILDVTDVTNGGFRVDDLRFECDPNAICADLVIPEVTITAPLTGAVIGAATTTLSASVVDSSGTHVVSDPAGIDANLIAGGGAVSGTVALVEGANLLAVTATDQAFNVGGTSVTVIRDTTAPSVTILSPGAGTTQATSPVTLSVQVADATATTVTIGADVLFLPSGGGMVSGVVPLFEGANVVSVSAVDEGGNTTTTSINLVLDLTAPLVGIDAPADGACFGPGEELVGAVVTINDLTATTVASLPAGVSASLPPGGGIATGSITLVEGTNTINVSATDEASLTGSSSVVVVLDTTPPTVSLVSPADGDLVSGVIDFDALAADVSPGSGVARVDLLVDGLLAGSLTAAPYGLGFDTTSLLDGLHSFTAVAVDGKGSSSTATVTANVDNTGPAITITTPLAGEIVAGTINFDSTVTDTQAGVTDVVMQVASAAPNVLDGSLSFAGAPPSVSVSSVEDTTALVDGSVVLTVIATDAAGNVTSSTLLVTVDNVPNDQRCLVTPAHGEKVKGVVQIVAGARNPGFASLEILVDGVSQGVSTVSPITVLFDSTSRLDGAMVVSAVETDILGNQDVCSAEVTVDNIKFKMHPKKLNLDKQDERTKDATVELKGGNLTLLQPLADHTIVLLVPGGSPIHVTNLVAGEDDDDPDDYDDDEDDTGQLHLKFDRQQLVAAVEAGIAAGLIQINKHFEVILVADGLEIGKQKFKVKSKRSGGS